MAGMPWIKLWTEILDDVKVLRLTDSQKWRFVSLILFAAECDAEGALVTGDSPVSHADVSKRLRCDINSLKKDMNQLVRLGLLHEEDGVIVVSKFGERQGPTQENKRKEWRERQKRRRERVNTVNVTGDSPVSHASVTLKEKDKDKDSLTQKIENIETPEAKQKKRIQEAMVRGAKAHINLQDRFYECFHLNVNWNNKGSRSFLEWLKERPPEQSIETFSEWWKAKDWRGKQGQPPTLTQIQELWPQAFNSIPGGQTLAEQLKREGFVDVRTDAD